jgi:hypothetical protein
MAAENFTDSVGQIATGVWRGPNGEKFAGVLCGLLSDFLAEGASTAWQASSLYPLTPRPEDYKTPLDAIERMGRDALILRYPGENHYTSLRPRVRNKWNYWAGSIKAALLADLAAAGFSGAQIFVPNDFNLPGPPAPTDYWSRFWIKFPFGTHPVTTTFEPAVVGAAVVGTDRIGPLFIASEAGETYIRRLESVVRRLKPAQWVCWNFAFEVTTGPSVYYNLMSHKRYLDTHYEATGSTFPVVP